MAGHSRVPVPRPRRLWRRLLRSNYPLANRYYTYHFRRNHGVDKPVILVHQMGKVGSSTIMNSLADPPGDYFAFHTHHLNPSTRQSIEQVFQRFYRVTGRAVVPDHVLAARYLRERLEQGRYGGRWKIISLTRDPVARNVSAFFQTFGTYFPELGDDFLYDAVDPSAAVDLLLSRFELENELPLHWFESEMKDVFGIDVFASPFPRGRGYETYSGPFADLLVVRLEDLNRCGAEACAAFLGLENFQLSNANVSAEKRYSRAYERFKSSLRLPESYLDRMYGSRYARHFYGPDEIERFRARWLRVSPAAPVP